MLPIGTRVTITSVDHLAVDGAKPPRRLIGRRAIVTDHENGMNIVSGLTLTEWFAGHYVFGDDHVTVVGGGPR
ncbi:hypothetical protein [Actinacidiphila acidipaludis]|uniref:Uncharacterized protein n=1 Tax=Actinacidiphila acidipaludis TaxID=2873382 RepID=A0ABS7Q485_9ACTN|nr:hypothetical protein [Streptomyces acidipaludis]MBY8877519.1 hypothetical protein [Streptomyces acidipaludis]